MSERVERRLVSLLEAAGQILIFTGAGISTGSGIPDYRGPQGIWKNRQPVYYQDFMRSKEARVEEGDVSEIFPPAVNAALEPENRNQKF